MEWRHRLVVLIAILVTTACSVAAITRFAQRPLSQMTMAGKGYVSGVVATAVLTPRHPGH
jgi:hypothetical protein